MGMLVEGLNRVMELWSNHITGGRLGTGTTKEVSSDIGIETEITGSYTTSVTTASSNDQFIQKTITFAGTSGTSDSVREMTFEEDGGIASTRSTVNASITYSTDRDLKATTKFYVQGRAG